MGHCTLHQLTAEKQQPSLEATNLPPPPGKSSVGNTQRKAGFGLHGGAQTTRAPTRATSGTLPIQVLPSLPISFLCS